jgi:hypothetical protein
VNFLPRAAFLVLLLLSACSELPPPEPGPPVATVYVVERGWHTDIGLAAGPPLGPLRPFEQQFPGARFFEFGFGERDFMGAEQTTPSLLLRALLPSEGLLLVTALNAPPTQAFAAYRVIEQPVSRAGLDRLTQFIAASIEWLPDGRPRLVARGPYDGSLFYASPTQYDLFDTCNTWTARGLRAAGLPVSSAGVVTASQVIGQLAPPPPDGATGREHGATGREPF